MESQARGGTRWRRFGLVMVPSVAATAAIGVALAQGALAASFAVSGQEFKVRVDHLVGEGFVQYGTVIQHHDDEYRPVVVSAFDHATINDLCQSVVIPVPFGIGDVTLRIGAGSDPDNPVVAENLFIDLEQLNADATFENIDIGVAAGTALEDGPTPPAGERVNPGSFAQQAERAILSDVEQVAWATSAGSFKLSDLSLSLSRGTDNECF
ncbi:DUF6230 family protein [Streptomyces litchfieldiae]|uniref:DUF6230 family protein n=1 Tax=Streptomyces litchfieldiae TaxID=3075543 RepID=A0ABU2MIH1_9ACTN|nr:DUF6230 family protein [Streptomyces sp. DSM 44938]MDT0341374.1 DUF6230 family protein [Streptomyces sp. DSM 44938]